MDAKIRVQFIGKNQEQQSKTYCLFTFGQPFRESVERRPKNKMRLYL
jgi:hypothetical protein